MNDRHLCICLRKSSILPTNHHNIHWKYDDIQHQYCWPSVPTKAMLIIYFCIKIIAKSQLTTSAYMHSYRSIVRMTLEFEYKL